MGTVYKETYTQRLPADAGLITRKGERLARWKDRNGRRRTAPAATRRLATLLFGLICAIGMIGCRANSEAEQEQAHTDRNEAAESTQIAENAGRKPEQAATTDADDESVIAEIERVGDSLVRDESAPGKPVIAVVLRGTVVTNAILERLAGLPRLQELYLTGCDALTNLDGLQVTGLQELALHNCSALTNFDALQGLTGLRKLSLVGCNGLTSVDGLKGLTGLQELTLPNCNVVTNFDVLQGLTRLRKLSLVGCDGLTKVDGLKRLTGLKTLDLSHCRALTNVDGLQGLTELQGLNLGGCEALTNVDALTGMTKLQTLDLSYCTALTNVDGLRGLAGLQTLNLRNCDALTQAVHDKLRGSLPETKITF